MSIEFVDYNKITDVMMFMSDNIQLKLVVNLNRKDKNGNDRSFHSEYKYPNEYVGVNKYSITRNFSVYYQLGNFKDSVCIHPGDLMMFRLMLKNIAFNWFIGSNRIYSIQDDKLVISGTYDIVEIPLNDYNVFRMVPIVCTYQDGKRSEGVRIFINSDSNFVDLSISRFWEFYYYMTEVDIYTVACEMVNYVKTQPYGFNIYDNGKNEFYNAEGNREINTNNNKAGKRKSFFDK